MPRKRLLPSFCPGIFPSESHFGFTVWVRLQPPVSVAKVAAFTHRLDQYQDLHGLHRSFYPLYMVIWSPKRSLSTDDQVQLLAWLKRFGGVRSVELGALHWASNGHSPIRPT